MKGFLLRARIVFAVVVFAFDVLVWGYGEAPARILSLLVSGTWGSTYGIGQVLFKATPLLFAGIAVRIALRAGMFNIGAEGQIAVASLAAGVAGTHMAHVPAPIALGVVTLAAAGAGAVAAGVPALLKTRFGVHEVISSIMMNRIIDSAIGLLLASGIAVAGTVRTGDIAESAKLRKIGDIVGAFRGSAVSTAFFAAVVLAFFVERASERTVAGREIGLIGQSAEACRRSGVRVGARLAQAFVLSGAVAGFASLATVLGYKGYFEQGLGGGAGFIGLAVALMGRGSPMGLIASAILFGTLQQGGLAVNAYVPKELMDILVGTTICAVAGADAYVTRKKVAA